jgi:hypothetical protein
VGWSILLLAILLQIKPQWAFALGIPVLLKHWRFLGKILVGGLLVYVCTMLLFTLFGGSYVINQYRAYTQFLRSIPTTFYWNTLTGSGNIGYNNSIMQLVAFFTNNAPYKIGLSYGIKLLLLMPLLVILWFQYRHRDDIITTEFKLGWAFALYLGAFILLDVVTELSLGIAILTFLLGTLMGRTMKIAACILFLPYALQMLWILVAQLISFVVPLPESLYDPSSFIPYVLLAMLGLYAILLWQLWTSQQAAQRKQVVVGASSGA